MMKLQILYFCIYSYAVSTNGQSMQEKTDTFLPVHPELKESDKNSVPPAKGKEAQVGNLAVYESQRQNDTKIMLITIYDIFGLHNHVEYIADRLAEDTGFSVVIPDLLHGNPVPLENFPQPSFTERAIQLFAKNGSWIENKPDLLSIIKHYKNKYGITSFGMYGYCWGGKISVFAASDEDFSVNLKAIGLVHPSRVNNEDAQNIKVPTILLPSKSEPDMLPFLRTLDANVKGNKSEHYRYDGMDHGFAGARSDFSDPKIRESVEDVIRRLSTFFKRVLS